VATKKVERSDEQVFTVPKLKKKHNNKKKTGNKNPAGPPAIKCTEKKRAGKKQVGKA